MYKERYCSSSFNIFYVKKVKKTEFPMYLVSNLLSINKNNNKNMKNIKYSYNIR